MFRPGYVSERFFKLIRKHGMPIIRFHDLRHSAATMLLDCGCYPQGFEVPGGRRMVEKW